jgi:hypothetical protein
MIRRTTTPALAVALVLTLTACGGSGDAADEGLPGFQDAVDSGAPCSELFEIRNSWEPDSANVERANETLRSIGCFSRTSERTD